MRVFVSITMASQPFVDKTVGSLEFDDEALFGLPDDSAADSQTLTQAP